MLAGHYSIAGRVNFGRRFKVLLDSGSTGTSFSVDIDYPQYARHIIIYQTNLSGDAYSSLIADPTVDGVTIPSLVDSVPNAASDGQRASIAAAHVPWGKSLDIGVTLTQVDRGYRIGIIGIWGVPDLLDRTIEANTGLTPVVDDDSIVAVVSSGPGGDPTADYDVTNGALDIDASDGPTYSGAFATAVVAFNKADPSRSLHIVPAGLSLIGKSVTMARNVPLEVTCGALTLTGQTVTLISTAGETLTVSAGTLTLTGQTVTLISDLTLSVNSATLALTGQIVGMAGEGTLNVNSATLTLTGQSVSMGYNRPLTVSAGTLTLSGGTLNMVIGLKLSTLTASLTLTGQTVTLTYLRSLTVNAAALTLTGQSVSMNVSELFGVNAGTLTLTGQTVTLTKNYKLTISAGTVTLTGQTVEVTTGEYLSLSGDEQAGDNIILLSGDEQEDNEGLLLSGS